MTLQSRLPRIAPPHSAKFYYLVIAALLALCLVACSGSNGTSAQGSNVTSVPGNNPRYAYAANSEDNSISIYALDVLNGRLKYSGKIATGIKPYSIAIDPNGLFLYAANNGSNNVSAYTIDYTNGALTNVGNYPAGTNPCFHYC